MLLTRATWLGLALMLSAPALAQETQITRFGDDAYAGGRQVTIGGDGFADVFAAGETVRIDTDITGTAHAMARRVFVSGDLGGLYAMGMEVTVEGRIAGDATAMGYEVSLGAVGGDLRASGSSVTLSGPVGGYALVAGDEVRIDGVITGDLSIAARSLEFGEGARVEGTLYVYEDDEGDLVIPASVAPAERIERHEIEGYEGGHPDWARPSIGALIGQFAVGVLIISAIAAALAAIMPARMADLRHTLLDQPMRSVWIGTLTQSALIGVTVIAAMTLIGILTIPAFLIAAGVLGFVGYVVGVYAFGVSILNRAGRELPDSFGDRALAAVVGALAAAVIALIPFLGWLFVLALALGGVGAILIAWANPRFFGYP